MKKLTAVFKKTKKQEVNVLLETSETISAGKTEENVKYERQDPKIDKISLSLCSVTKGEVEETCTCAITSNSQQVVSFRNPSNRNIKNVVGHSVLRIGHDSSMSPRMSGEPQDFLNQQMNSRTFNKQNTCVLNINNSRCFHIGPQKIIDVKSHSKISLQKSCFIQMTTNQWTKKFNDILEVLLESYEMPTKEVFEIIALGLKRKWKEFGRKLGFTECSLYEIELQNERNMALIAYDMLKQYICQFPNTTFGFIISILIEMNQKSIVQEIILQQQS